MHADCCCLDCHTSFSTCMTIASIQHHHVRCKSMYGYRSCKHMLRTTCTCCKLTMPLTCGIPLNPEDSSRHKTPTSTHFVSNPLSGVCISDRYMPYSTTAAKLLLSRLNPQVDTKPQHLPESCSLTAAKQLHCVVSSAL
jgi:hypothetical protein